MDLAAGLARSGWHTTLVVITSATAPLERVYEAGVHVEILGAGRGAARARALPRLVRLARAADVVHCTLYDATLWGRLAAALARRPAIVTDHSTNRAGQQSRTGRSPRKLIALHNRVLEPLTYATVAVARAQFPLLLSEGVREDRLLHVPNGLPIEALRSQVRSAPDRNSIGIPADARVVMHVARFRPLKNQPLVLDAVAALRSEMPDLHVVFVGDGPGREELESRARELGDWAHFLGRRLDAPALISLADVVVLPSDAEAMPMTLVEAMAAGVPFVGTDVGDIRAVVEETGCGIVVPRGDGDAFRAALRRVLTDDELHARLARDANASAPRFDSARMVERYSRLLGAAADRAPAARAVAEVAARD
jgi:glycosyltransferase involved in cell wall biosynthesis